MTLLIIGIITLAVVFFMAPNYVPNKSVSVDGPYDLSVEKEILSDENISKFYSLGESTIQFFVYLNPLKRTGIYTSCGTNPNQPSCSDGTTGPCQCASDTGDCSICASNGYLNLIDIAGVVSLHILPLPDAGRQDSSMIQLTVKTETPPLLGSKSTASQKYIETFVLPPLPYQQWVMITISKEGRRFDVSYNTSMVLSQKTMNMPVADAASTNGKGCASGAPDLMGTLASVTLYTKRQSSIDIDSRYKSLADSRGKPYSIKTPSDRIPPMNNVIGINPVNFSPSFPTGSWCMFGGCVDEPTIQPANPMYSWSTSYA